jgi:hypothetical protein
MFIGDYMIVETCSNLPYLTSAALGSLKVLLGVLAGAGVH